jgi:hypothetical protein
VAAVVICKLLNVATPLVGVTTAVVPVVAVVPALVSTKLPPPEGGVSVSVNDGLVPVTVLP